MGNALSPSEAGQVREDVLGLWPGLEVQLERSFSSHATALGYSVDDALTGQVVLSYSCLEPVVRHHLMQCGQIEHMTRLVDEDGRLNTDRIADHLRTLNINPARINISEWKMVVAIWISAIQQLREEDLEVWNNQMQELQDKQAEEYESAIRMFQDQYITSLQSHQKRLEERTDLAAVANEEWIKQSENQEEFMETQKQFAATQQAQSDEAFERQKAMVETSQQEYLRQLSMMPQATTSEVQGITTYSFAYPAAVTATGCPVSLGSSAPLKNEPKASHRQKKRAGCC